MATIEKIYFKKDDKWEQNIEINLYDWNLKGDKRGISFISSKGNNKLINDKTKGFCHRRFKANFVIDGINVKNLTVGQVLKIGDALIKITETEKECTPSCPVIKISKGPCNINKEAFYGEVIQEGLIKEKDRVAFI